MDTVSTASGSDLVGFQVRDRKSTVKLRKHSSVLGRKLRAYGGMRIAHASLPEIFGEKP